MSSTNIKPPKLEQKHYIGHRQRLRERFLNSSKGSLPDYELLEIMLFAAIPRSDVKPLAKQLLLRFGNLAGVITAHNDELKTIKGVNNIVLSQLKAVQDMAERLIKQEIEDKPVVQSWKALLDYCRASMGHLKKEQFRMLFLNKKLMIIADEVQEYGTVDQTPVYPREVVKRALQLEASSIIMVHNHPSGDVQPSKADIQITKQIMQASESVGIILHDHVIISSKSHYSFKSNGMM